MPAFFLLTLDVWIFAIGGLIFCLLGNLLIQGLAPKSSGALGFITTIVTAVPRALFTLTQKLVATFAPATLGPQKVVAAGLHDAARLTDDTADVLMGQSATLVALAGALAGTVTAGELAAEAGRLGKRVGNAEAQARGIGADVLPRLKHLEHELNADVLPRIRSLDKELNRDITNERKRAKAAEQTLTHGIDNIWNWARSHPWTVVTDASVAAVAVALSRLGLDWIKCDAAKSLFQKRGCSLWSDLDKLLGLVAGAFVLTDICAIIPAMESAFSTIAAPAVELLTGVAAGLCKGVKKSDPLTVPAPFLPAETGVSHFLG